MQDTQIYNEPIIDLAAALRVNTTLKKLLLRVSKEVGHPITKTLSNTISEMFSIQKQSQFYRMH